jgi:CheY-like chemotaxis protein
MINSSITVLLIEDDDVSSEAVVRSFKKNGLPFRVVPAEDGQVALEILRHQHPDRVIAKPYVILLDLNMPRMNGFEFLHELRADPALNDSIIFVLTTSDSDDDRLRAYQAHVAGYMVKANVGPQFSKIGNLLNDYRESVELP